MKKLFGLALAFMLVLSIGALAFADEHYAGSVNFPVKWTVEPMINFSASFGENYAYFSNGELVWGDPNFSDYIFDTRVANYSQPWFGTEDIHGLPIFATVDSNDWWQLVLDKPYLVSDNDNYTTVPVLAKRYLHDYYTGATTETDWMAGNDVIIKDLGVHDIMWDMKVQFNNWNTRYGNYENVYTITVTQF